MTVLGVESATRVGTEGGVIRGLESYVVAGGGGFVPTDLTNLFGWWDASDAATFTYSSGVSVSQWGDKSAAARHFNAASSGDEPDRNATINSLTAVHFDAAAWMQVSSLGTHAQPFTVFAVAAMATGQLGVLTGPNLIMRRHTYIAGDMFIWEVSGGDLNVTGVNASTHLFAGIFNGASSTQRLDGAQVGTGSMGTGSMTDLRLGDPNDKPLMDVGEFIVYNRVLTGGEITQVETYLMDKWFP